MIEILVKAGELLCREGAGIVFTCVVESISDGTRFRSNLSINPLAIDPQKFSEHDLLWLRNQINIQVDQQIERMRNMKAGTVQ